MASMSLRPASRCGGIGSTLSIAGNSGEYGSILFGGSFSGDPGADFFLGYPEATGKGVSTGGSWHQFSWTYAGYFQDDWRVTPTLTLNLGLRYEAHTPWVELNNRQDNMNLQTGEVEYAGVDGNSRSLYNSVYGQNAFQPRIGFAWSPEYFKARWSFAEHTPSLPTWKGPVPTCAFHEIPLSPQRKLLLVYNSPTYTTQQGPGGSCPGRSIRGSCHVCLGQDRSACNGPAVEPYSTRRNHLIDIDSRLVTSVSMVRT